MAAKPLNITSLTLITSCLGTEQSIHLSNLYLLLAECEVRTASYGPSFFLPFMAQAQSARAMKTRKEKTRIHNLPVRTWANEANKMFIIWLCWLFRFWKGDRELEVCTAIYGPGIDQSQHMKSVSHIIKEIMCMYITFKAKNTWSWPSRSCLLVLKTP